MLYDDTYHFGQCLLRKEISKSKLGPVCKFESEPESKYEFEPVCKVTYLSLEALASEILLYRKTLSTVTVRGNYPLAVINHQSQNKRCLLINSKQKRKTSVTSGFQVMALT